MASSAVQKIRAAIRDVPDFPKPGILFKDIMPMLQRPELFRAVVDTFAKRHEKRKPDVVVGIDARGFIFAGAVAYKLGAGFVAVRKKGKLPFKTIDQTYDLEYGSETLSMHVDAIPRGARVLIVDDVLATGGTARAAADLVKKLGGKVIECDFLIELTFLPGRKRLGKLPVFSAIPV
jgi:adenine phosphoribosyltransferase